MAEASPHWLAKFQNSVGGHTQGHGTTIAVVLAIISVAVAHRRVDTTALAALAVGIVLSLAYWVFGQDLGGPFWAERRDRLQRRAAVRAARGRVCSQSLSVRHQRNEHRSPRRQVGVPRRLG